MIQLISLRMKGRDLDFPTIGLPREAGLEIVQDSGQKRWQQRNSRRVKKLNDYVYIARWRPTSQEGTGQLVFDDSFSLKVSLSEYAAYQHRSPISGSKETPDL